MRDMLAEDPRGWTPAYLLALIEWLPSGGAWSAVMQDRAPAASKGGEQRGPHRFYERGVAWHQAADGWDLAAAVGTGKGKPPTYPRPGVRTKSAGVPLRSLIPKGARLAGKPPKGGD